METVWKVFSPIAALLAVGGWLALRRRGERAPSFRIVGWGLLGLAAGTAAFPLLLPRLGVGPWVAGYIGFVVLVVVAMTCLAVTRARPRDRG